jgi:tetratricopeptide (TPR) repeat protein
MRSGHPSVTRHLLLFLTLASCAQKAEPVLSPKEPSPSEIAAARDLGIDAPDTRRTADPNRTLDLDQIREAFAESRAMTVDEASARESRSSESRRAAESTVTRAAPAEDAVMAGEAEETVTRGPPSPPPRPPVAEPKPEEPAKVVAEFQKLLDAPGDEAKEKEKAVDSLDAKKGEADGTDKAGGPAKPVLPQVARRESAARILIETESGAKALVPRAIRVMVEVQGPRARTVVDYVFENPHDRRLEGTFFHPLPADASPAHFAMFDGTARVTSDAFLTSNRLLPSLDAWRGSDLASVAPRKSKGSVDWGQPKQARVVAQQRAREVYEDIVRHDIDPGLLELGAGSDFEARVFPLEPRSLKRVVVAYEQPLAFDGKAFRYGFTVPSDAAIKERSADVRIDLEHGRVTSGPSGAKAVTEGAWARWSMAQVPPGFALELAVEPLATQSVLRGRDPQGLPGDAFYASVRPDVPEVGERATGRALFVIDTSLSSEDGGAYARRAKLIRGLLEKDRSIEQYAVMLFDVRPRWLHAIGWRARTDENVKATMAELERVYLEGATSFASVLDELARQRAWAVDGQPTTVFLLSDGHITWGLDKVEALAAHHPVLRDVRWITYRFGEEPANQALFDLLSSETGGRTVAMLSEAEIDAAVKAHLRAPAELLGVEVKGARAVDLVVAGDPRHVFPGQVLQIGGRLLDDGPASLVVRHRISGKETAVEVPLTDRDDELAPRAFADLHTKKLIALDDPRLDRMIVAISQHYRLANARASFLVVDDEQQVEQYALAGEQLDLSSLLDLRKQEMDARRDALVGLSLDGVQGGGLTVLEILRRRADGLPPELPMQPLLEAPFAGGRERASEEVDYRRRREAERMSYSPYEHIARVRALSGDTMGAVRALSSAVELRPRHGESMRLVGYALMALAQYDVAAELFERVRLLRPFEGQAFLEEALALEAAGRADDAARNYEILLARSWARHDSELDTTARYHYGRLLRSIGARASLDGAEAKVIAARIEELGWTPVDYSVSTHWSSDSVDIDLWVYEPTGEKCWYQNRGTSTGGVLYWDTTDGLGPELYHAKHAAPGAYDSMVHYYGSSAPRLGVPAALLVIVDGGQRRFLMRVLPEKDAVLMLRTDVFDGRTAGR